MSDDNNQNTLAFQLQGLARQLDEIRQQLQQQSQPTPTVTPSHMEADDDYDLQIIERPVASDLIHTEQLQRALPGMADDFFRSPLDEHDRKRFIHDCSRNAVRQYLPPVLNLAENVGRFSKHHDGPLSEIQRRLAATTCPIDKFLHESLRSNAPSIPIEEVIYFMNTMHTLVSDTASHITHLQMDNVSRETGLIVPPIPPKTKLTPNPTPLFQYTKAIADSTNLRKAVQAASRKPQRRQFNCNHPQQPGSTPHHNQQSSGIYDSTFKVGHSSSNVAYSGGQNDHRNRPIGGRLSSFSSAWSKLSSEKWVQSVIEKGYRIPFSTSPPTSATYQSQLHPHLRALQLPLQGSSSGKPNDQSSFNSTLFTIPKKTGGGTSGPQPKAITSVSSSHTVQDGNHEDHMQSSSEGVLHDKYRFDRCFSPCISSRNIQKVSTVSLESQDFSISHHPFLTFSEPYGVHQVIETGIEMGTSVRNIDLSISRRPVSNRKMCDSNSVRHEEGNLQIRGIRVPRESKEITAKSVYNHSASRLFDQHRDEDINGTHQQDTRHSQVSSEIITPDQGETDNATIFYRQSSSHLKRSNQPLVTLTEHAKRNLQWWIQHLTQWNGHTFIPKVHHYEPYTDASMTGWGIVDGSNIISARIPQPFCNVEARRSGDSNQCNETDLDYVQQPVYLPALEHDTQYTSEAAIGSGKGTYADNTTLDQCNMVPSPFTTNAMPQSVNDPTGSSPSSSRTIAVAFGEESTLAVDGMAPGSLESFAIIYDSTRRKLQHQRYDGTHQRFLNLGTQHNRNVLEFVTAIDLVNYLAYGHVHHKWVYSTNLQYKQGILQLYTTEQRAQITSDPLYIKFFAT
ncbi:hypothetical protein INT48_001705 [Thamnidium elegans]|uniref:Uncharacterized protein n=1 Tax=Thamnidium elegans TaxID=101142 RepID=A0A8H7VSR4_9FUNG|nr:hypothetical protein INT48_001705 [Thamnidium elegans]